MAIPVGGTAEQPPTPVYMPSTLRAEVEARMTVEQSVPETPVVEVRPDYSPKPGSQAYTMLYWTILGLHPEWRPDACAHPFAEDSTRVVCERTRDKGQKWASQLALWIYTEATRQAICTPDDARCYLWFAGQGQRESGLSQSDICKLSMPASWVEEIPENAQLNERVRMCWRRGSGGRNCQQVYLRSRSAREYVVDRCAYGEVGIFQVRSHEARMGQVVPATGESLPGPWTLRREWLLDPQRNISLAFVAFATVRDYCCGVGDEADEFCRAHPDQYILCYNTGQCRGNRGIRYVDKIGRTLVRALRYTCSILPELTFGDDACTPADMAEFFTPPGRPRHRQAMAQNREP